jgi:NitT/TauT family transport system substrate-binding protein
VAEGLTVELLPSPGVGLAEQALLDGTAEVIWVGPMRVMKHHDDNPGSALVCFAEIVCRDPFSIIGLYTYSDFPLADLARMRIATVSEVPTPWFACRRICGRLGSTPRSSIALPIAAWLRISWRCARAE